jgi:hypothetical protein
LLRGECRNVAVLRHAHRAPVIPPSLRSVHPNVTPSVPERDILPEEISIS